MFIVLLLSSHTSPIWARAGVEIGKRLLGFSNVGVCIGNPSDEEKKRNPGSFQENTSDSLQINVIIIILPSSLLIPNPLSMFIVPPLP